MLLQPVDKRYPLKAIRTLKKQKKKENYFLERTYATWEYKCLLGSDSILYARCCQFIGKPLKTGAYHNREKLNLGRSDLSDPSNNIFGPPARPVSLIRGPRQEKKKSTQNHHRKTNNIVVFQAERKFSSYTTQVPVKGETIILLFLQEKT